MRRSTLGLLLLSLLLSPPSQAQEAADPKLLSEINRIKAVDNHAHVMSVPGADGREDEINQLGARMEEEKKRLQEQTKSAGA